MAKYQGVVIGIHSNNSNVSISLDTEAKNPPLQVSFKDFGQAMVPRLGLYDTVEFEADAIGHPFIVRGGVKTSERVKNPRARNFKLLAVEAASDNLEWDDDAAPADAEVPFDPTEG